MTSWKDWKYCSCIRPCFIYCLKPCFSSIGDDYGFKDCKHLDFSHCNLKEVPDEIFSLERTLEELLLDVNSIRDLPRVVFHCTGLKKLSLSDNEIETLPNAISSLVYLEYLNLSRNSLLVIPDGIKCCKCLIVLDCSVNPLGKVPDSLTQLINLQELYLNDIFLEYLPANFGRLSKLRIVELRENNLKILPKSFQRLINLERLDIGQNELVEFPEVLCNLTKLQELWIDGNRISSLPEIIGNLTKLTYLDASENRIVTVATKIAACHRLTDLLLSGNKIVELPETLGALKYLTYLRLDDNKLTSLPQSIGGLASLQELVMSNNYIQSIPKNIGFLRNLHSLIMDCNQVKELPDTICSCSKLRLLSVASNELFELPEDIGRLGNLRVLNLRNNQLKFLPYSFANITNLQTLWLSDNQQKPIMKLQTDTDESTNRKVLTCFLLPQQSSINYDEAYVSDHDEASSSSKSDAKSGSTSESRIKFYSANGEIDEKDEQFISKLVRNPTPYPKELKAHARHARNLALKRRDSFGTEIDDENSMRPQDSSIMYQQSTNLLSNQGAEQKTSHTEIKEAKLTSSSKDFSSYSGVGDDNYDNQLPHNSLMNQEELLRTIILKQQSNSQIDERESPSTIEKIIPTRINANNTITSHSNIESANNFQKQFSSHENYQVDSHQHQLNNRPMTIYNNKPVENLLSLSSSSPSPSLLNYQENSPRSNHPSPSSTSSYTAHLINQPSASLERQALIRTAVAYTAHREQPVMTQYAPNHNHHHTYLDDSSPHNPLIGFNDSNRSSIKSFSQGNNNMNVSGGGVNDNYGSHMPGYTGTSNRITTIRNQPQQFIVDQNTKVNFSDDMKHLNNQYYPPTNPSTSHQIVQQQQQSIRKLLNTDAIIANHHQQLTKIMMAPSTITNMKVPSSSKANENEQLTSSLRFNNINTPSQVIYKQFPVTSSNQLTDYEAHIIYKNQQQQNSQALHSSTQLNQLDHQLYNQSKHDQNQSQPTDNLLTTVKNPSGS